MLIITGISNETINELTIYMQYYVETSEYFTDNNKLLYSSAGKIENVQEFKTKLFE